MNTDSELALINGLLQKFDPRLSAQFNPSKDIESEDSEFEILRDGKPYRHDYKGELSGWTIQCCMFGGEYSTNRDIYRDGQLDAVAWHYEGKNLRAAVHALVGGIIEANTVA